MIVKIGKIEIGGKLPVAVQSMANTDTNNITESVEQCIRISIAGADIVRLTVQGKREVESLSRIRALIREKGYNIPLVADVHYSPKIAFEVAKIVEKVRINPGNYTDTNLRKKTHFTDEEYRESLLHIKENISPLLKICKENCTAIRIGVNHGSLSDRIMARYGDTPEGMAESAMEFVRICHQENFLNLVISMKASNTRVMVYACRLLAMKMQEENLVFPLHLGVTEAGAGNEGRVRSAVGIASLLQQGIGDTIRVSLTEDPENEIPVAKEIASYFTRPDKGESFITEPEKLITAYQRRLTRAIRNVGGNNPPIVISDNCEYPSASLNKAPLRTPDYCYLDRIDKPAFPKSQDIIVPAAIYHETVDIPNAFPSGSVEDFKKMQARPGKPFFLFVSPLEINEKHIRLLKDNDHIIIVAEVSSSPLPNDLLNFFNILDHHHIISPVIIKKTFSLNNFDKVLIRASGEAGLFFLDGLADGIWLSNPGHDMPLNDLSFDILQASRVRTTATEFISCPSCGRTRFDIKNVLQKVKSRTSHLTGLKIAVMGCIVNGPGEMADADYGYIGSGQGKVNLYKGRQLFIKNIPEDEAIDQLIRLIKDDGKWKNP